MCLIVLAVLPHGGDFLPWDGPSSDRPAPPSFFVPAAQGHPAAEPLIVEVYYRAVRDDEYVVVGNPGDVGWDLSGWSLSDLEGSVTFPPGTVLEPRARVVVTRNATSYREDTLRPPDFTYDSGDGPRVGVMRIPRLANDGDEVLLTNTAGTVVDVVAWGHSAYEGPGWVGPPADLVPMGHRAVRASAGGAWSDSDSAADWNAVRTYPVGQEDRPLASFRVPGATAFLSPDDALPVLASMLRATERTARIAVYRLTNEDLAAELAAAARRGVDVQLLIEGSPVGGIDRREWSIVRNLSSDGVRVRFLVGNLTADIVARYRYLHAKYAVLDGMTTVIGSENWGTAGFPAPPRGGNRGWHVAIRDPSLASYLGSVFLDDFDPARRDTVGVEDVRPRIADSVDGFAPGSVASPRAAHEFSGPIRATAVLGPDHTLRTDTILGAIGSATHSIDAELLQADVSWDGAPNPYLEALLTAARRGVCVRLLLDGSAFSPDTGRTPNEETAEWIHGVALSESLPFEARRFPTGSGGISAVHAKGFVVDGRVAFVGSLNWNRNSATRNREVGVLLEGHAIASYFASAFADDWALAEIGDGIPLGDLGVPSSIVAAAVLAGLSFRRRRRRTKEL